LRGSGPKRRSVADLTNTSSESEFSHPKLKLAVLNICTKIYNLGELKFEDLPVASAVIQEVCNFPISTIQMR